MSLTVDAVGNAYFTGSTLSHDFPLLHPFEKRYAGAYVAKLDSFMGPSPVATPSPTVLLQVSPDRIEFGKVTATTVSGRKTITIRNISVHTVLIGALTPPISFIPSSDGCSNVWISPKATCVVDVAFCPSTPGSVSEALVIPYGGTIASATLQGSGIPAKLSAIPKTLSFKPVLLDSVGASEAVAIENDSDTRVRLSPANLASSFQLFSDKCSGLDLALSSPW